MVSSVSLNVPIWFSLMSTELATPRSMPFCSSVELVTKLSSPTSWIFAPSRVVRASQPSQSCSAIPSSSETIG